MHAVGLTRAAMLAPIVAVLEHVGAPIDGLLARAGVPVWTRDHPEMLVPCCGIARLLAAGARTRQIVDLGFVAGRTARLQDLGLFGRLVRRSPTLGDALEVLVAEHPTFSSGFRLTLRRGGEQVELSQTFATKFVPSEPGWQQANHYVLMLLLGIVGLAGDPSWRPPEVCLQTAESIVVREADPLAGAVLRFAQPATSFPIPRTLLARPLRRPPFDPGIPSDALDAWRAAAPAVDFLGSIVQAVETLSWDGYPDIHRTADFVGMSVRTLQRQLAEAGMTHEALVGRARFATAAAVLEETDLKILDIALDLGYSDHAHFTRAFRRWAGCSPQEYRRRRRRNPDGVMLPS